MKENEWVKEFPGSITICDKDGILLEMNDAAEKVFEDDGGRKLLGSNVLDCHPEPARTQTEELLTKQINNVYTIEKDGIKKLIYQSPWYKDGKFAGLVEISLEIPFELQHFIRT